MGRFFGGPLLALAKALERPLQRQVGRVFRRVDVVLAPTTAKPRSGSGRSTASPRRSGGEHLG
jgi:hypothetical protein